MKMNTMSWPTSIWEFEKRIDELTLMNEYGMIRPDQVERNKILINAYKKEVKRLKGD